MLVSITNVHMSWVDRLTFFWLSNRLLERHANFCKVVISRADGNFRGAGRRCAPIDKAACHMWLFLNECNLVARKSVARLGRASPTPEKEAAPCRPMVAPRHRTFLNNFRLPFSQPYPWFDAANSLHISSHLQRTQIPICKTSTSRLWKSASCHLHPAPG
jgi:hypothetical protein